MFWKRPPVPFEFRGETVQEPEYEYLAVLEAAAKRRRAAFRPMSADEQRRQTREAQAKSGLYVRVERPIVNYADFTPQMKAWYLQEAEGKVARRKLGRSNGGRYLHLTLLDTRDPHEMLGNIDDSLTEEDILRKLGDRCPTLFRATGRVAFSGIELFGPKYKPWVALPISKEAHSIHQEREVLRRAIAPNCGESENRLHMSLGDITIDDMNRVDETFRTLRQGIAPLLPQYGEYGPVRITVGQNPQAE